MSKRPIPKSILKRIQRNPGGIDALVQQWDRFSEGNLQTILRGDKVHFAAYDNGGSYEEEGGMLFLKGMLTAGLNIYLDIYV